MENDLQHQPQTSAASASSAKTPKCTSRSPSPASATGSSHQAALEQVAKFEAKKRKLWSRLYADLNRTIDDMYTLSEMEQNLWQARNIVQFLDESTADFRQLQTNLQRQGGRETPADSEGCWPTRNTQPFPRHHKLFQQLLSRSGLSPDPDTCCSPAQRLPACNIDCLSSSNSAPEPSSRAPSPQSVNKMLPRPASAAARLGRDTAAAASASLHFHDDIRCAKLTNLKSGDHEVSNSGDAGLSSAMETLCATLTTDGPADLQASQLVQEQRQMSAGSLDPDSPEHAASSKPVQFMLKSPQWQRKTPSEIQQQLDDRLAAAAQRRSLQQVQMKAKHARAQADREAVQSVELQRKMATERQLQQKQARSSELRSAHLKRIRRKALDETTKVHEVLFINKLQNKDKELTLMQRLQDAERRQAETRAKQQQKQREVEAAQQEAQERRQQLADQRLSKLAEKSKRAAAAALKLEEERRAEDIARIAKGKQHQAVHMNHKQAAKEHAEQLEARLAQRLHEAAQRRVSHLDQIRERAAISKDDRDTCPPMSPRHIRTAAEMPVTGALQAVQKATFCMPCSTLTAPVVLQLSMLLPADDVCLMQQGASAIQCLHPVQNASQHKHGIGLHAHGKKSCDDAGSGDPRSLSEPQPTQHKAISAATTAANRLKGMRRRAAKLLTCIHAEQQKYEMPKAEVLNQPQQAQLSKLQQLLQSMQQCFEQSNEQGFLQCMHQVQQVIQDGDVELTHRAGLLLFVASAVAQPPSHQPQRAHDAAGSLLLQLLSWPGNCHAVLASQQAESLVQRLATVLDAYLEEADKSLGKQCQALEILLQAVTLLMTSFPEDKQLTCVREHMVGYILARGIAHRLHQLFSLFDRPQGGKGAPFPACVGLALQLMGVLTSQPQPELLQANKKRKGIPSYAAGLIYNLQEIGLAGMLSILTAVLLDTTGLSHVSAAEPDYTALPNNFSLVAEAVLRVLNNLAMLDLPCLQQLLGGADLRLEIFHVVSFLLMYVTRQWVTQAAQVQVDALLHEVLIFIGLFAVLEARNQDVLLWGSLPTPVHKLCLLSAHMKQKPDLACSLSCTLLAVCVCNQRICEVVEGLIGLHGVEAFAHRHIAMMNSQQTDRSLDSTKEANVLHSCSDGKRWRVQLQHRFPTSVLQRGILFLSENHELPGDVQVASAEVQI